MKKIMIILLALLCVFYFVGCGEEKSTEPGYDALEKFTTPGYDALYEYCDSPGFSYTDLQVHDYSGDYYFDKVTVERNNSYDYISISVDCPKDLDLTLMLKEDTNICDVRISLPSTPWSYGEIDLKTFSPDNHVIDGLIVGELYGSFISEALIALEPTLIEKVGVSLKDLGFINY